MARKLQKKEDFYPRPPRGGRLLAALAVILNAVFLSTPSARRATEEIPYSKFTVKISIHALREEGDEDSKLACTELTVFLSTPSARRATAGGFDETRQNHDFYPRPPRGGRPGEVSSLCKRHGISIHALREEGDPAAGGTAAQECNFYPRPPRGGRPPGMLLWTLLSYFYPRPPRGGRRTPCKSRALR